VNNWVKGISMTIAVIVTLPTLFWLSGYLLSEKVVLETERAVDASPEAILELPSSHDGLVT
jgi:hypothetical protein